MGSYYYIKDKYSKIGFTPVPEDEYVQAVFRIAKKHGLKITNNMILKEVNELYKKGEKSSD